MGPGPGLGLCVCAEGVSGSNNQILDLGSKYKYFPESDCETSCGADQDSGTYIPSKVAVLTATAIVSIDQVFLGAIIKVSVKSIFHSIEVDEEEGDVEGEEGDERGKREEEEEEFVADK